MLVVPMHRQIMSAANICPLRFLKEAIPEKFILNEIQQIPEPFGNIIALKDLGRLSVNRVQQLEARLMLIKSWIDGNEDQLSKEIENDGVNLNKTCSKKKECEQIGEEIKNYCNKIANDYQVLQLKNKLLLEKVKEIEKRSAKLEQLKQEKWGKVFDIMGPHMPEKLSNFEEQLQLKVESAQHVYKKSIANIKSLKKEAHQLKEKCEELLKKLQEKEAQNKDLKQEKDKKISQINEDLDISEKMINVYESLSNVTLQKTGKNFIQVKMTREIGEHESISLTLIFKPSDYQGILLEDIHVSNKNLFITDCVENGRCLQNIPACLNSIRERWYYYLNMAKHFKDIQQRLPVDWIQQENKLRVVVGKDANIICTLKLPSAEQSWVSLLGIRGGENEINTDLLMPSNPEASLQQWIEYLEKQFS